MEALDSSADAVQRITRERRGERAGQRQAREANVFDELRRLERENARFDTIVLDPPAFAKNKASVPKALAGYKEINLRALHLLSPGGYLVTCSCSYNVDEAMFGQVLYEAAVDSHTPVTVVEKRMQGRDHPVLLGVPETYYLEVLHPPETCLKDSCPCIERSASSSSLPSSHSPVRARRRRRAPFADSRPTRSPPSASARSSSARCQTARG